MSDQAGAANRKSSEEMSHGFIVINEESTLNLGADNQAKTNPDDVGQPPPVHPLLPPPPPPPPPAVQPDTTISCQALLNKANEIDFVREASLGFTHSLESSITPSTSALGKHECTPDQQQLPTCEQQLLSSGDHSQPIDNDKPPPPLRIDDQHSQEVPTDASSPTDDQLPPNHPPPPTPPCIDDHAFHIDDQQVSTGSQLESPTNQPLSVTNNQLPPNDPPLSAPLPHDSNHALHIVDQQPFSGDGKLPQSTDDQNQPSSVIDQPNSSNDQPSHIYDHALHTAQSPGVVSGPNKGSVADLLVSPTDALSSRLIPQSLPASNYDCEEPKFASDQPQSLPQIVNLSGAQLSIGEQPLSSYHCPGDEPFKPATGDNTFAGDLSTSTDGNPLLSTSNLQLDPPSSQPFSSENQLPTLNYQKQLPPPPLLGDAMIPFKGGDCSETFFKGLILYSNGAIFYYDIAEAPFHLNQHDSLKLLTGSIKIKISEETNVDHVRCHVLKDDDLIYCIEELYENNSHVVAVLLINSNDSLILDPKFKHDLTTINIPIYVVSSVQGTEIIGHLKGSTECHCSFDFSDPDNQHRYLPSEIQKASNSIITSCPLLQHLKHHLFPDNKTELVTENISVFQTLMNAFTTELMKNSAVVLDAVKEININLHKLYKQEFLFLIVLFSQLAKCKQTKTKVIESLRDNFHHQLINLNTTEVASVVNSFYKRGDFMVNVIENHKRSIFHLLHTDIASFLNELEKRIQKLKPRDPYLLLITWITAALKFKYCSHSPNCTFAANSVWRKFILPVCENNLKQNLQLLSECFKKVSVLDLPYEDSFVGSDSLQDVIININPICTFSDLKDILLLMKMWVKKPEQFNNIFCVLPLSIHMQHHQEAKLYVPHAIGRVKSEANYNDIVIEGFGYVNLFVKNFCDKFGNAVFEEELKKWITFLLHFLNIADEGSIGVVKSIQNLCGNKEVLTFKNLKHHFISEIQMKGLNCLDHMTLNYFTHLSQVCNKLWPVQTVVEFFRNYQKSIINDTITTHKISLSHFSDCFRGAFAHSFLIKFILTPISKQDERKGRAENYMMELVELDVQYLLKVQIAEDKLVVQEFTKYLTDYVSRNKRCINFSKSESFKRIQARLCSANTFNKIILDIVAENLYGVSLDKVDISWLEILSNSTVTLMNQKKSLESYPLKFYWKIIGGLCERLTPQWEHYNILQVLARINRDIRAVMQESRNEKDIEAYFSLVEALKNEFNDRKRNFSSGNVTFDDINEFLQKYDHHKAISDKFGFKNVAGKQIFIDAKQKFISCHQNMSQLLIKVHPNQNWVSLHEILATYRIAFPDELACHISKSFYFPHEKQSKATIQHLPYPAVPKKLFLSVKLEVTLNKIVTLSSQLDSFLNSIKPILPLLEHFHLNESKIFHAFVEQESIKYSKESCSELSIERLAIILKSVKNKLQSILTGTAVYNDIFNVAEYFGKGMNLIQREMKILADYEEFKESATEGSVYDFRNMLILIQVADYINDLYIFCVEFELQHCLNDRSVIKLRDIMQTRSTWQYKSINQLSDLVREIQELLGITASSIRIESFEFLKLFHHLNTETKELRVFLNENNFRGKGKDRFLELLALVTQALQHEEYNAEILNTLYAVYCFLVPLNKPDLPFQELVDEVSKLNIAKCQAQLKTVNSNIDLIKIWFSKAEGDTVANTMDELESISSNGKFSIGIAGVSHGDYKITLQFKLEKESADFSSLSTDQQSSRLITWNNAEIQDFIRRLGFTNLDDAIIKVRWFTKLNEMVMRLQKSMRSLHEMCHTKYSDKIFPFDVECSRSDEVEKMVEKTEQDARKWLELATRNRVKYKWLCFLSNYGIIGVYKLLQPSDKPKRLVANEIWKQIRFLLVTPYISAIIHFESAIDSVNPHGSPTEMVGSYLDTVFQSPTEALNTKKLAALSQPSANLGKDFHSFAVLHQCQKFTCKQLIQCLYSISGQFPKCYQLLRCHSGMTARDLKLFFQRIDFFPRCYFFLQVDKLSPKLQEILLQQYMELHEKVLKNDELSLHFIETSSSLLHNAPYIDTVVKSSKSLQHVTVAVKNHVQLVYGLQGNGKTHYIRSQLTANSIVFAVNETFSIGNVIDRLNSLPDEKNCSLFFNFTLLRPGENVAEEERLQFKILMDRIGWFMFDFLVLGYIHDQETGASFSVPVSEKWTIYIEVPSISNTCTPEGNLEEFKDLLPIFHFIGIAQHIDSSRHYVIDDDVQLVCKYLRAYKIDQEQPGSQYGINKRYYDFHFGEPALVKFSTVKDLDDHTCRSLLDEYMPLYIKERKISQKLFIKYIKRRCLFLDNLPQYNYNQGRGTGGGDTKKLGSTLMNAMLKEVYQFCDPLTKKNWFSQAHQQLIYEGVGSIGLISLYPDKISQEDRQSFTEIAVKIPSVGELFQRKSLDEYLARALSLPLAEVTEKVTTLNGSETHYKRLQLIDKSKYVLTLDFALKMINIHERRECGMPVIIEGETGVGKTELLRMLSKLWNCTYEAQLSGYKQKLEQTLSSLRRVEKRIRPDMSLRKQLSAVTNFIDEEESLAAGWCSEVTELRKIALELRKSPLLSVIQPKHQKEDFWRMFNSLDDHSSNKEIVTFLQLFITSEISTFHKLNVHSGLKPVDIVQFFNEVTDQAERIKTCFSGTCQVPQVTAYLDEINTSSCMGLFKEIIVDRTIDGEAILDNIFVIAACNPLRSDSTVLLRNVKNVWVKPSYYVRELHPTIEYLKWDYGALNDIQEMDYVNAKMNAFTTDEVTAFKSDELTCLIVESQNRVRQYACQTLINQGMNEKEANQCSRSCVSQRDIQRVFDFYQWLFETYKVFQRYTITIKQQLRALLVSLGLVYFLRLGEKDRENYAEFLNEQCAKLQVGNDVNFTKAFDDELDWYMERMSLPPGIAKTRALKENVFANIACCQTHTPLIIIGEPGTSKTLSFNLVTSTLKGNSSKNEELRNVDVFHALQPFFYQCSKHTNSIEIENLFKQAIERQTICKISHVPTYCVVFMDEAGLPEERHESLKVLHYHLDRKEVSFVAITNHALDAAKTNRAISLYRPETSTEDLTILAQDLLHTSTPMTVNEQKSIIKFCSSFSAVMTKPKFQCFYGQRDFMHFISYLRRRRGSGFLTEDVVLEALERNFNGHENFSEVFDQFLDVMGAKYDQMKHRNILEMIMESLLDLPLNYEQEASKEEVEHVENVRYKLIIDNSEDDSAVRYLFSCNILNRENTQMVACSDFSEESGMHISTIAEIIHAAENGHTIIMFQTDKIHESLYELFNQRFRIIDDPQKGIKLFTNISIGAHTKPCRVNSKFQCIVVVKKSDLIDTPQAFLSRFEKFFFSYNTLYKSICENKPPNLNTVITIVVKKVISFVTLLNASRSFYGYCTTPDLKDKKSDINSTPNENTVATKRDHETLYSFLLSMLPSRECYVTGCVIEEEEFHSDLFHNADSKCLSMLITALSVLRSKCGWNIPKVSIKELESDCKAIFEYLLQDPFFSNAIKDKFGDAIGEALDAMHSSSANVKIMADDSCLIVAVIVQWLVRYITKHMFHLMTPEALVINARKIPTFLMKAYFEFQEHFNFKCLVKLQISNLESNKWNSEVCPSKIIVYTRQSYLFGRLPSNFPQSVTKANELLVKDIIYDELDSLKMLKVSPDTPEGEISREVANFINNRGQKIFVLIANMQDLTVEMINYLRIVIEQKEDKSRKLFVLLLHFPQFQFFNRCYPALFLTGWDHFYLDSLTTDIKAEGIPKPLRNVVDIKQCFCIALKIATSDEVLSLDLEPLLEVAIPVISSRVIVGSSGKKYNKTLSVSERQELLRQIFIQPQDQCNQLVCTPIGKASCTLFHRYWDNKNVVKFLQDAANFTFHHQSTLSITSYIQTRIKALFFEFIIYVLWMINQDCNLDTLFSFQETSSAILVQKAFADVIKTVPGRLQSLKTLPYICRSLHPPENKNCLFPFFTMTYHFMEELIDGCHEIINKKNSFKKLKSTASLSPKATKEILENEMFEEMKKKLNHIINVASPSSAQHADRERALASVITLLHVEDLWDCYFHDFIKYKWTQLPAIPDETILSPVMSTYFNFDQQFAKNERHISHLAWLHVHAEVHKTNLNQIVEKLKGLKRFITCQPHQTITQTMKHVTNTRSGPALGNLETMIIEGNYAFLHDSINDPESLRQWYWTYKDIVEMESLYNSLHDLDDKRLRLCFFKVHIMYTLIHCQQNPVKSHSLEFCILLYNGNIKQIPGDAEVEDAFSDTLSAMIDNNCSNPFIGSVVDMLFSFMFHTITPAGLSCYKWFFKAALPSSSMPLLQYITSSQYKYYLLLILKLNDKSTDDQDDVLQIFTPYLRREIINLIDISLAEMSIDSFYINDGKCTNVITLTNAYIQVVYQVIELDDMKPLAATTKLKALTDKVNNCKFSNERHLLMLEKEAFKQRFLQLLALNLADSEGSQGLLLGRLPSQIDALLKDDEETGLILCMHLWNKIKSTEKLSRSLKAYPKDKLICLNKFKKEAEDQKQNSITFSFPLLIQKESELEQLYSETCEVMLEIHHNKGSNERLEELKIKSSCDMEVEFSIAPADSFVIKKNRALCMCIWLCSFYEFYLKKIKSEYLANAIYSVMEDYFSEGCIRLIMCFINSQLIEQQYEQDLSSNPNAPVYEYDEIHGVRPLQGHGIRMDPIYKLFFPNRQDDHASQLCNGLANLVAAILACPDDSNHLWYHLLSPDKLARTHVTGFLLDSEISKGRLYDCGVVLDEEGRYGRPEYLHRAEKGILTLHSLYHLLWCNFGAFCVNLLTQRDSVIKGTVISSYQAIRHYCKSQLSLMWLHMSTNIGLTDEQLSLLIVCSMKRMIQISCKRSKGLIYDLDERNYYERMWHNDIFIPSKDEVKANYDKYLSKLQADDLVAKLKIRELNCTYLHVPTFQHFTHYVQEHCASSQQRGNYSVLVKLLNSYPRLQAGSTLLPSLIEFYQWIITDLSHVLTKEESTMKNISDAVDFASEKYSEEVEKHYTKLFESVREKYNIYLEVIGFSIGAGACANVQRENAVPKMVDTTPVFRFLPGGATDEQEEQDYLFLVIQDIVNFHNSFLNEIKAALEKHLIHQEEGNNEQNAMACVHPLAVNEYSCILGENVSHRRSLLELVRKHQTRTGFDLDKIQEEFVTHFIAGKLPIDDCQTKLKMQFRYRSIHTEQNKMKHPTELMLTLDHLDDAEFMAPIPPDDDFLTALKYELFTLDYEKLVEVAQCLKTIAEHIKKTKHNFDADDLTKNVGEVLPKIAYAQDEYQYDLLKVFEDLGINKLQSTHCVRIAAIPMKHLLTTLILVVQWIKDGIYDFHTLPKAMKIPLKEQDESTVLNIPKSYEEDHTDDLLEKLKGLVEVLTDCEQDLIKNIDTKPDVSIFQYLKELSLVTDNDEKLIRLFPEHVKLRNYMALRICLRRIIIDIEEEKQDDDSTSNRWSEYVDDLWSQDNLEHLRELADEPIDYSQVYDPVKDAYGFELEFTDDEEESICAKGVEHSKPAPVDKEEPSPPPPPPPPVTTAIPITSEDIDLRAIAEKVTPEDMSEYLQSLNLQKYIENFLDFEIDGIAMLDMNDEILKSIGVDTRKDQVKMKMKYKNWLIKRAAEIKVNT